jgi:drug/metabolite transporter (DMT)-like permease
MKTVVVLVLVVLFQTAGNLLVSRGMKQLAVTSPWETTHWFSFSLQMAASPSVWLGTLLLIIFFVLYAALLSWADLSFVLPASSFGYVLNVALAHYLLLEPVSMSRWFGTMLISIGVVVVSMTGTQSAEAGQEETVSQRGLPG